jgi:RHS repeat-associated protein
LFSAQLSTPNHKTEVYKSGEVFTISDFIDDVAFNTTSYKFGSNLVDVTNNEGITTRIQYQYGKPICSYELIGDMSQDVFNVGSIHVHKTMENDEDGVSGTTINYRTGIGGRTDDLANNEVHFDVSSYVASGSHGRYVLTGWMKRDVPDDGDWIAAGDTTIQVINGYGGPIIKEFTPNAPDDGQWRFFAYTFYANVNSLTFNLPDNPSIHVAGLRLSHEGIDKNIDASYFSFQSPEYILISNSSTGCKHIPISAATFRYQRKVDGVTTAFNLSQHGVVCFEDLFRFKFNKRKGAFQSEAYANKGKLVLDGDQRGTLTVTYTDPASNQTYTYNVDQCHLGICQYTQAGEVVTRIRDVSTNTFLLYETTCDGTSFTQKVNNFLDVIEEEENDVVKTIARNQDLISSISVTDRNNTNNSFTRSLEYITEGESNIIVETDEFGDSVTFVLDPIWGTVKSTTMPDDSEVSNSYDDDMCALTKRVFGDAAGRANMMTYSNGRISAVESGSLSYAFSYDKNKLSAVSKNASSIEAHTHTTDDATGDPKTVSYYPSESSTLYSTNTVFDKYGNLKNVEGILEIEYKDLTGFDDNDMPVYGNATRDCSAKVCEDKLCGEKITLVHDITGKAIREDITDATSNALIRQEKFKYDKVGRLSKSHLDYNLTENQSVSTAISYVKKANKPLPDNRVEDFAYGVNFQEGIFDHDMTNENCDALAKTTNTYDSFKRVTAKKHVVGGKTFNKLFHYTKTRVTSTSEKIGNTTVNSTEYQYNDHCGRITAVITGGKTTSYHYDLYGQLVREDNKPLDATFVYVYNEIGNLTSIEKYAYTASSVTPSGTPITTTIGYTNDKLTNFGGTTISYNSIGCPTTYEGKTAIWARGKLSRLSVGTMATGISNYAYTYNAFGQRIGKTYTYTPGKSASAQLGDLLSYSKSYYYDHAGRLISESVFKTFYGTDGSSESIVFLYDESGIIGMARTVGSTTNAYYFQRNLLGDVVAIYDTSGNMVAKYLYDAWGNCTISSETTNTVVANANPIRYRGYYYDDDTGLYYCNARYYSPKWRRFISPDDTAYLDPESVNGLNLYCYSNNNPVNASIYVHTSDNYAPFNVINLSYHEWPNTKVASGNVHWKGKWFDTDWPGFLVLTRDGFEVMNWGLAIYKGSLYFDHAENHSVYVGIGNLSAYIGVNFEEGIGIDASASVLAIGYDGRIIDASIEALSAGLTYMWKDWQFEFGYGVGLYGWSVSIDFLALFKLLFGRQ